MPRLSRRTIERAALAGASALTAVLVMLALTTGGGQTYETPARDRSADPVDVGRPAPAATVGSVIASAPTPSIAPTPDPTPSRPAPSRPVPPRPTAARTTPPPASPTATTEPPAPEAVPEPADAPSPSPEPTESGLPLLP